MICKLTLLLSTFVIAYNIAANGQQPKIIDYDKITLPNCGLTWEYFPKNNHCYKWHRNDPIGQISSIGPKGRDAETDEFPWVALLRGVEKFLGVEIGRIGICSASLLNKRWIITAAHCVREFRRDEFEVYFGNMLTFGSYRVSQIHAHPSYKDEANDHDIALVQLDREVKEVKQIEGKNYHYRVNGICLPEKDYEYMGTSLAAMAGWGLVNRSTMEFPKALRVGVFETYPNGYPHRPRSSIFVRSCSSTIFSEKFLGDSGGGLFQYTDGRAVLIGINSATLHYDGYNLKHCTGHTYLWARVSKYIDWINATIIANN